MMTGISLVIMGTIIFAVAIGRLTFNYFERGRVLNEIAVSNISYGLELPDRALEAVGNQMIVSALLVSELVALAEQGDDPMSAEEISDILQRVIDRSVAWQGRQLIDEFWVTDETGHAYIATAGVGDFTFPPVDAPDSQAARFRALLEPNATPVVQPFLPRDSDGKSFSYAGVGGVDKPRIVQVGLGDDYINHLREKFTAEEIMSRFFEDTGVDRIAIVNADGGVEAAVGEPFVRGESIVDDTVMKQCLDFLNGTASDELIDDVSIINYENADGDVAIGVATRLPDAPGAPAKALFIQHQVAPMFELIASSFVRLSTVAFTLLLIAILVGMYLSRRLTKPLADLADAADAFGQGNLAHRVVVKGDREVQALATTFNGMAESLQRYTRQLEQESRKRERLESDLRIGAEIQQRLLPSEIPKCAGLDVAAWIQPARRIGGDYYDFAAHDPSCLLVALGDASGKGLPAALLITECASLLQAFVGEGYPLDELLARTNRLLCERLGSSGNFVTLFIARFDPEKRELRYSVAGHNPAMLIRENRIDLLHCNKGLPLGIEASAEYEEYVLQIEAGDTLAIYSDGVTEAQTPQAGLFGEERLQQILQEHRGAPSQAIIDAVRKDVGVHMRGAEAFDDMTLVVVTLVPEAELASAS